jgi:RNA polymerase sigma-70 factor (ECF subfamily)
MGSNHDDAAAWLSEHGDYLYAYCMSRLYDEETSADLVQETLLAAWKNRAGFKGEASLRTWLTGILKHKITDHIRQAIRQRKLAEESQNDPTADWFDDSGKWVDAPQAWAGTPEALYRDSQFRKILDMCLKRLPEKQRQVFVQREMGGVESSEICKNSEISTTHLHVLMHRARLALRTCLDINWFGGERRT